MRRRRNQTKNEPLEPSEDNHLNDIDHDDGRYYQLALAGANRWLIHYSPSIQTIIGDRGEFAKDIIDWLTAAYVSGYYQSRIDRAMIESLSDDCVLH